MVKPELIAWARRARSLPAEKAASRIGVSVARLREWESGAAQPTIKQLRTMASVYRKAVALFYLPAPPESLDDLPDLRRLLHVIDFDGTVPSELPTELADAVNDALYRRDVMLELDALLGDAGPIFACIVSVGDGVDAAARTLRAYLGAEWRQQQATRSPGDARRYWFNLVREAGVLVFQYGAPLEQARGFSVSKAAFPIVAVNSKDADVGRTISVVHELTHVALSGNNGERTTEVFCNAVAGRILVPSDILSQVLQELHLTALRQEWQASELKQVAREFGVSRETVARRLLDTGRMTDDAYTHWRAQLQPTGDKKRSSAASFYRTLVSKLSKRYASRVFDALDLNKVTLASAARYLQVTVNQVENVRAEIG